MAEYSGKDLVVVFNTVDISGAGRRVRVREEAGEPEEIDVTHKGDTERQVLETYPGAQKARVEVNCLDESDGEAAILDFAINAQDTLFVYPEGQTHGNEELTLNSARLISRDKEIPYDGAVEVSSVFSAKNSLTYGTYSST